VGRLKITEREYEELLIRVKQLERLQYAVEDLLGHHLETPARIVIEPEPLMAYGVRLVLDGGYSDLQIAQAVACDIWAKRHRKVLERLSEL
jgi:hypothetical protein